MIDNNDNESYLKFPLTVCFEIKKIEEEMFFNPPTLILSDM